MTGKAASSNTTQEFGAGDAALLHCLDGKRIVYGMDGVICVGGNLLQGSLLRVFMMEIGGIYLGVNCGSYLQRRMGGLSIIAHHLEEMRRIERSLMAYQNQ